MTDKLRAAAQVALEALELSWASRESAKKSHEVMQLLRAALAEQAVCGGCGQPPHPNFPCADIAALAEPMLCASNDSPWLICRSCFAKGACKMAEQDAEPVVNDGWLQAGGLLYRLTDERRPQNRDEINVAMADGSRSDEARTRRAGELLDRIRSVRPPRRNWIGLTRDEVADIALDCYAANGARFDDFALAAAIEAALKEKNA